VPRQGRGHIRLKGGYEAGNVRIGVDGMMNFEGAIQARTIQHNSYCVSVLWLLLSCEHIAVSAFVDHASYKELREGTGSQGPG
jgi:hypothetical protein